MSKMKEGAVPGIYHVDSPPRLSSSHCGNYHNSAVVSNQSSSGLHNANKRNSGDKMSQELMIQREQEFAIIEQVVIQGDLAKLSPEQRVMYYRKVCDSVGLNHFSTPFQYLNLQGKLSLYANKSCTEQLRTMHSVSIEELDGKLIDDIYVVTAKARNKNGRVDQSTGAVVISGLKGDAKANAIMKAETKAKRRVTLSICGLGMLDESEIDSIPKAQAQTVDVDFTTGEIKDLLSLNLLYLLLLLLKQSSVMDRLQNLEMLLDECDPKYKDWVYLTVKQQFKTEDLSGVPSDLFDRMKSAAVKNMNEYFSKQIGEPELALAEVK